MSTINRTLEPAYQKINEIPITTSEKFTLKNGISMHVLKGGIQPVVKLEFLFFAGSKFQNSPLVAGATNKLCTEGTSKKNSSQIAEEIDYYGAYLETECNTDYASLKIYSLTKHIEPLLQLVCEIISDANFPQKEFQLYIDNSLQKFLTRQKRVNDVAAASFQELLFGRENFYGRKTEEQDFKALKKNEIENFFKTYYNINNLNIFASGNLDDNGVDLIKNYAESLSNKGSTYKNLGLSFPNDTAEKKWIERNDAMQCAFRIGKKMFNKTHSDFMELQVLNTILGGYFGSRLMKNIREDKGYTYGIGSSLVSKPEGGYWIISSEVGAEVCKDALSEVYKELQLLCDIAIEEDELNLVKNYMMGQLLKNSDGIFSQSERYIGLWLYNLNYDYFKNYISKINNVTPKRIQELANDYLKPQSFSELVVGKK